MKSAALISICTNESTKPNSALYSILASINFSILSYELNQQLIMLYIFMSKSPKTWTIIDHNILKWTLARIQIYLHAQKKWMTEGN